MNSKRFQKLINYCIPNVIIPTDDTIINQINPMFNIYKEKVKKLLWSTDAKITICVDGWQSKTTTHFLGLTCHILYNNKIEVLALGFVECVDLDGVSIFNEVKKIVEEYVIGHRVIAICTDNSKNFPSY